MKMHRITGLLIILMLICYYLLMFYPKRDETPSEELRIVVDMRVIEPPEAEEVLIFDIDRRQAGKLKDILKDHNVDSEVYEEEMLEMPEIVVVRKGHGELSYSEKEEIEAPTVKEEKQFFMGLSVPMSKVSEAKEILRKSEYCLQNNIRID